MSKEQREKVLEQIKKEGDPNTLRHVVRLIDVLIAENHEAMDGVMTWDDFLRLQGGNKKLDEFKRKLAR